MTRGGESLEVTKKKATRSEGMSLEWKCPYRIRRSFHFNGNFQKMQPFTSEILTKRVGQFKRTCCGAMVILLRRACFTLAYLMTLAAAVGSSTYPFQSEFCAACSGEAAGTVGVSYECFAAIMAKGDAGD